MRNEARVAAHRDVLIGERADRVEACRTIDGIGAGADEAEGIAHDVFLEREKRVHTAGDREDIRSGVAKFRVEDEFRRHRQNLDAGKRRSLHLLHGEDAYLGELPLAFHGAKVGNRRSV
jgi:hypothetical protein